MLVTHAARAAGRIVLDRVAEGLGRALPRTPEQLARTGVLDAVLRSGAPPGLPALPPLAGVRLPGVFFESSNCTNFLVELDFAKANGPGEPGPRTAYVKLPCDALATRVFGNAVGFWALECVFCERIAHRVPIRVPRVYAVARRGSRFVLVLEDLGALPGARLFLNRDMAAGASLAQARMALASFAELHAAFWGWDAARRESLLPAALHTFLAPGRRAMTRALNASAIAPAQRAEPELFPPHLAELCRRAIARWDAVVDAWYAWPLTLVHGDSHLGNCFEHDGPDGRRMGLLDFQGIQWCPGIRDVQYFLIDSLEPEVLAAHEGELLEHYRAELARHGVSLAADLAREQHRAFSFQTLMAAVVPLGLGALTERAPTLRTVLRRSAAAVERLDFAGWLDGL